MVHTEEIRAGLCTRLRARREEIEQSILTRVYAVSDSASADPEYLEGQKVAVAAAVEYGIAALERSEGQPPPMPTPLLAQARLAARQGIKLETVLRRYLAGYAVLGDFLVEESERDGGSGGAFLKRCLRAEAVLLDRVITAISEEYAREEIQVESNGDRLAQQVELLLEGHRLDTSDLAYDIEGNHLGLVASGPGSAKMLRRFAKALDCRSLVVSRGDAGVWGWLGSRRTPDAAELEHVARDSVPAGVQVALGEPASGLEGWRLTHRQARAAMPVALRADDSFARYGRVALVASMLQDDLLATSLRRLYLDPLAGQRDGGTLLRRTLRAFYASDRNISSTAAELQVNRKTVVTRLRAVEQLIGRPLSNCAVELEAVLRFEEVKR